ncbi:tetratricopeptide repeat protein [Borreliella turdi]|uniref:tetratricopeptide repeat protein n=1 Tax=Borreliella turdi TaxID=57863 RepID=UPI001247EF67|nr:hypothetical protein [Borreliella turdi]WKC78086.1 hypothetical protein QIA31_03210 [Borreliella turdi]WKC79002.1 hypothetical protein QIA30_03250 [Borreliella turdi]
MHKVLFIVVFILSCSSIFREYQNISGEYYNLAKLNEELGNDETSVLLYEKSIKFNINAGDDSSYNFILAYINLKKYVEAELKLNSIIEKDPENILLINLKGYLFFKKNDLDNALIYYLKTLEFAPANKEALFNIFYIYHLKSDKKNAKKYILKYKELNHSIPSGAEEIVSSVIKS